MLAEQLLTVHTLEQQFGLDLQCLHGSVWQNIYDYHDMSRFFSIFHEIS